jgi:hypothetical protein
MGNAIFLDTQIVLEMSLPFSLIKVFRHRLCGYKRKVRQFAMRQEYAEFLLGYAQRSSC